MEKTWVELLNENEETILEAIRKAYRDACGSQSNSGFGECVDITREGKVSTYTQGDNSMSMDVWEGDTMEVYRIKWFNPVNDINKDDIVAYLENENLLDQFVAWLLAEEHTEQEDIDNEGAEAVAAGCSWAVDEWNSDAWAGYVAEVTEYVMDEFDPDVHFEQALQRAEEYDLHEVR